MRKCFIVLISLFCFLPSVLNAEVESLDLLETLKDEGIETSIDYKENDTQTTVYMFRTKGEEKCIEFLNYLNDIYEQYGEFFKVRTYEVSLNEDNKLLMDNTIDYLSSEVNTTPFMVIGSTYFITYNESINHNFEKTFIEYYLSGSSVDTIDEVLTRYYRNDTLIMTIFLSILILIPVGIVVISVKNKLENRNTKE